MTRAHHDVLIDCPPGEVFDFLANGTNNPDWQLFVASVSPPVGDVAAGSTVGQRVRHPLGFTVSADYRVSTFERPRRLAIEVISGGPVRPSITYDLAPAGRGATSLRCTIEYHPSGLAHLASPALALLHPLFAWEASAVERVKHLLERPDHSVA